MFKIVSYNGLKKVVHKETGKAIGELIIRVGFKRRKKQIFISHTDFTKLDYNRQDEVSKILEDFFKKSEELDYYLKDGLREFRHIRKSGKYKNEHVVKSIDKYINSMIKDIEDNQKYLLSSVLEKSSVLVYSVLD